MSTTPPAPRCAPRRAARCATRGAPALLRDLGLHRVVAAAGAAGDPLRVQLGPLAHVRAGLLAALVLDRPDLSVRNDPTLRAALRALPGARGAGDADRDAARDRAGARPAALARARRRAPSNVLMLLPLVTPELVFAVGLFLLFTTAFGFIGLGTTAQVIGHVTFSISWVVLIVRGRLVTIGNDVEEAAADLGAPPWDVLRRVVLPLLAPAIAASLLSSSRCRIDDFVVAQYLAVGRRHDDGPDAHLRAGARRADAGAERAGHAHARLHAARARAGVAGVPRGGRAGSRAGSSGWARSRREGARMSQGDIRLDGLVKRYGDVTRRRRRRPRHPVGGEFFTMLGPSGCGKTTTLRLIAGFERLDAGPIRSTASTSRARRRTSARSTRSSSATRCSRT